MYMRSEQSDITHSINSIIIFRGVHILTFGTGLCMTVWKTMIHPGRELSSMRSRGRVYYRCEVEGRRQREKEGGREGEGERQRERRGRKRGRG